MSDPTMKSIVIRVLTRELESRKRQAESIATDIHEMEQALIVQRERRAEVLEDITVLEGALADLGAEP